MWSSSWKKLRKELLFVADISTIWAEVNLRVKWKIVASRWCFKSGPLNLIDQFSCDVNGWKSPHNFVIVS